MRLVRGTGPKIIWLQLGNCTTAQIEAILRSRFADIEAFDNDPGVDVLALS